MKRALPIILIIAAVLVVGGAIYGAKLLTDDDTDETATSVPKDWPVTPRPADPQATPGDGQWPDPIHVEDNDAREVATRFASMATQWDTSTDKNETEALQRAKDAFGAPELKIPPAPERTSPGWAQPTEHRAYTVVGTAWNEHGLEGAQTGATYPPTGETVTPAAITTTYGWEGRDGWVVEQAGTRDVYLSLVERNGEWKVIEYRYRDSTSNH